MSALAIHLLGRPQIERDGQPVPPPRGAKSWAVLAYVLLSEQRVPRAQLAGLIFGDASDPLGALRWTLAQLRKALGTPEALAGDPLEVGLPDDVLVDVRALARGTADPRLARGELLAGVEPGAGAVFESWLLVERRRLGGMCEAVLRDAALQALAHGDPMEGATLASKALTLNQFDESAHELLVRCLARAGDHAGARRHAGQADALLRRELGRPADPRVARAAEPEDEAAPAGDPAAAEAQLDAGNAALAAGAVEPGVACLRQAAAEARATGDEHLTARALSALGYALVHAVRGRDEEGAAHLHEALALAERTDDADLVAQICRELGYVEVQAGRAASAGHWLGRASRLATTDLERAAVLGVRGMALGDRGHYAASLTLLTESVSLALAGGAPRQAAWSLALAGRTHVLRHDHEAAIAALDESLALVERDRWIAFQPFPEALRAEVALRRGEPDLAAALLDHAFTLGCRLGDPCWEGMAARARGLVHEAQGERALALACLRDGAARAVRMADPYVWIHAYCLEALATVAIADGAEDAAERVAELERVVAHADMRELIVRAALLRARLGDPSGVEPARLLAEAIDNPALHAELAAAA